MSKHDHPRVGEQTNVQDPDKPITYAEFSDGAVTLLYEVDNFGVVSEEVYKVVTVFYDSTLTDRVYSSEENVSEETARNILDGSDNGVWDYVE